MNGELIDTILFWTMRLVIVLAVVWLVLWILGAMRRKSLNLTTTETVRQDGVEPGFLKVDHEKRDAALRGGEAFDTHVARRDAPPAEDGAIARGCGLARIATVVLAVVSLVTGIIGALMRVEAYDSAVRKFGVWDNIQAIVSTYPLGFTVSIAVIGLVGFNTARTLRGR